MELDFSKACIIKNCSNKTFLRCFCKKHYLAILKNIKFKGINDYCVVKGCNNLRKNSKFFCAKHNAQFKKYGRINVKKEKVIEDGGITN